MNTNSKRRAFTLVELIMVIVILGLLAAVVIPKYFDVRSEAQSAAESGTVAGVKSGISLYHMAQLSQGLTGWPTALDTASNGNASTTNPLFTNVLDSGGITDGNWRKTNTNTYQYQPTGATYAYDPNSGNFTHQ